jgi:hypothetical protein
LLPVPASAIQALALGLPAAYVQGYGNSSTSYGYSDASLFLQDDWRPTSQLTFKAGLRYQTQFWPESHYVVPGYPEAFEIPKDRNNVAPRLAVAWNPGAARTTTVHAAYGLFFDNHITGVIGITDILDGREGVRTLVQRIPGSIQAWRAPGRRLAAMPSGSFPSLVIALDPGLKTPYAHHTSTAVEHQLGSKLAVSATFVHVRGANQLGTIDYNPIVPALGAGRRPIDINGVAGTSASVLQYTSFGRNWYRGIALSASARPAPGRELLASYTLSKAEDNSTDFQSAFLPENNGRGRSSLDPKGLPVGFDPTDERGPSLQDQRHRFVGSVVWPFGRGFLISGIVSTTSGRPFNTLAGSDLNGDGDGGAFPPDRARTNPADPTTSIARNTGRMPWHAAVDVRFSKRVTLRGVAFEAIAEAFNLFNRSNFTEVNNIFGAGAYPSNPLPTFGRFEQAAPPRQVQIGARVTF